MINRQILDNVSFISLHTKDILKRHYYAVVNDELFNELERLCRERVVKAFDSYDTCVEANKGARTKASNLIHRIKHYYEYSIYKESPKMRFTKNEYESSIQVLSQEEKDTVIRWMEENGGYDKYIFSGFGG